MIDLICPKCQTILPVAENKIGTRLFVCPQCAYPLETPAGGAAPAATPPAEKPKPLVIEQSEDKTMAPDPSLAYVQEKLRQVAQKRADLATPAPAVAPRANRRPIRKKSGLALVLLVGGGVGALGVPVAAAVLIYVLTRGGESPAPALPPRDGVQDGGKRNQGKPPDAEPRSVDVLVKALKESPAPARKKALQELKGRGQEARPALATVLSLLNDSDADVRTLARQTIIQMGAVTKNDLPLYAAALREQSPEVRAFAVSQLAELGQQAKSELLFLRVLTLDENATVQVAARKAVLRIEDDLLLTLTKDLQDKSAGVRSKAARELAEMGAGARAALPNLVEALADKNSAVRLAVLDVFLAIGPDAVMVLGESLRDQNPDVRLTAINALGRMGSDARFVMPELIAVTVSADAKTKEEALQALARIGDYAIPFLIQALEREKNPARQKPLLEALERMGASAAPALQAALKAATPEVNKAAAPVLVKMESQPKPPSSPKDHTGPTGLIQSELRAWFFAVDTNRDGFLDKEELARAIRGAKAKAYDYTADGKPAKQFGLHDFEKYPDFAFLCRVDRDNDGKISRDEFERWAYDYAEVVKKDKDDRDRITQAQMRLSEQSMSAAMRQQTEANIRMLWAAYHNRLAVYRDIRQMQWLQRWMMDRLPRK